MAIGCTHAHLIEPVFEREILAFRKRWNPHRVVHLGDWSDTEGLLKGGEGSGSEGEPLVDDMETGLDLLERLHVTDCTMGNHDERPYRFLRSTNPAKAALAQLLTERIEAKMKALKINWVNSWDNRNFIQFGGFKWFHGYMYGENATRDHAEAHGNCVHAHTHRSGMAKGRRDDNPTGFCVGTGTKRGALEYAKCRRATLAWSQGLIFGEYSENSAQLYLHEQPKGSDVWRLPV